MQIGGVLAKDIRKYVDTLAVSPGPSSLYVHRCVLARGRAVLVDGVEREDVGVDRFHIPKFCAVLHGPHGDDREEGNDKTGEIESESPDPVTRCRRHRKVPWSRKVCKPYEYPLGSKTANFLSDNP